MVASIAFSILALIGVGAVAVWALNLAKERKEQGQQMAQNGEQGDPLPEGFIVPAGFEPAESFNVNIYPLFK